MVACSLVTRTCLKTTRGSVSGTFRRLTLEVLSPEKQLLSYLKTIQIFNDFTCWLVWNERMLAHWTRVSDRCPLGYLFISLPEPKALWWAYRIGRPLSSVVCPSVRPSVRHPHSLNIFSWETTGPIEAKFHIESPWMGERRFVQTVLVTWPRWLPCPYMVKTLKNLLLRNQKADDLETWYAASGARVLPSFFRNDDPWLTLTYFTARSNLVPYAFVWEKGKTMDFSETIVVYDLKLATDDRSDKKFLLTSKFCPLGAVCHLARGYIHVLNHEKNCIKSDFKEISLKLATNE